MNIGLKFRERLASLGQFMVGELDQLVATIAGSWDIEHQDDGSHGDIHGKSLTITKGTPTEIASGIFSGNITTDGQVTATGPGTHTLSGPIVSTGPLTLTTSEVIVGSGGNPGGSQGPGIQFGTGATTGNTYHQWDLSSTSTFPSLASLNFYDKTADLDIIRLRWTSVLGAYELLPDATTRGTGKLVNLGSNFAGSGAEFWDAVYGLDLYARSHIYERSRATALGDWVAYTPTFTNITVGNGVMIATYARWGNTVAVEFVLVFGSTTTIAAAATISLPVNNTGMSSAQPLGDSGMYDVSAGTIYPGHVLLNSTSSAVFYTGAYPMGLVTAANPFTWATGDQLVARLLYQGV